MPNVLKLKSKGTEVEQLQKLLIAAGFPVKADGDFGAKTEVAVKAYQTSKGLSPVDGIVGGGTWGMLLAPPNQMIAVPQSVDGEAVIQRIRSLGLMVHEDEYVLNLFGIRAATKSSNSFDDILGCFVKVGGKWAVTFWPGTTDPGTYWLQNPSNVAGTAMLVEGQYTAWQLGMHQGSYEALCQRSPVKVYRDGNRNSQLDPDPKTIQTGTFGINIHRSSATGESKQVDRWSAGCQVHAVLKGFQQMMILAHRQVEKTGKKDFTYTLLKAW